MAENNIPMSGRIANHEVDGAIENRANPGVLAQCQVLNDASRDHDHLSMHVCILSSDLRDIERDRSLDPRVKSNRIKDNRAKFDNSLSEMILSGNKIEELAFKVCEYDAKVSFNNRLADHNYQTKELAARSLWVSKCAIGISLTIAFMSVIVTLVSIFLQIKPQTILIKHPIEISTKPRVSGPSEKPSGGDFYCQPDYSFFATYPFQCRLSR